MSSLLFVLLCVMIAHSVRHKCFAPFDVSYASYPVVRWWILNHITLHADQVPSVCSSIGRRITLPFLALTLRLE